MEALVLLGWVLAIIVILAGLAGTIMPGLPGPPFIFAGLFGIAWLDRFQHVRLPGLIVLALLAILSVVVDFLMTAEGARRFGAGRWAVIGAAFGLVVGLFFGLPGIVLGPFLGAVLGHLAGKGTVGSSVRAGVGASLGMAAGMISKVVIAVVMLVLFVVAWWV